MNLMNASLRRKNLERLLRPQSVAIIGASSDAARIGGRPVRYLKEAGFKGEIYPINPKRDEVQGLKSYPSISAIGVPVDVAVVAVPAAAAVEAIADCARAGVGGVVLFSSDFAESGPEGAARQAELTRISHETGIRILGPNCLGMFDATSAAFLTFSSFFDRGIPSGGHTALISQSGGFGSHLLEVVKERGIKVGTWVTTGNEADVEIGECLEWAAGEPSIQTILVYAEGVSNGKTLRRGLELARDAGKPVVFMKAGRSARGVVAATTHTAALAGSDAMYQGIFDQFGVRRVFTAEQMADVAYVLDAGTMPANKSAALFTVSGAGGVQMADSATDCGLDIPEMPAGVQTRIKDLAPFASPTNPIDFTAQALNNPDIVEGCLAAVTDETDVGSIVIYLTMTADDPGLRQKLLGSLSGFAAKHPGRLFLICMLASPELVALYEQAGFRVFEDSARAVNALGIALREPTVAEAQLALPVPVNAADLAQAASSESGGKSLLSTIGLRVPLGEIVPDAAAAAEAAARIGFPVVIKIVSEKILHKSDVGGVRVGISNSEEAMAASEMILASVRKALPAIGDLALLVEQQVNGDAEFILGVERDPVLGTMVMAGLGGVMAEIYKDVSFRMAPVSEVEALRMLDGLRAKALFGPFRGRGALDTAATAKAISDLSLFAFANRKAVVSIDINPLLVEVADKGQGSGAMAADCVIVLNPEENFN